MAKPKPKRPLEGRLRLANGWLVLAVPDSLQRGLFRAARTYGGRLPDTAAVPVLSPQELVDLGGPDKIDRDKPVAFTPGELQHKKMHGPMAGAVTAAIHSPQLDALRKQYGLPRRDYRLPVAVLRAGIDKKAEDDELDPEEYDLDLVKKASFGYVAEDEPQIKAADPHFDLFTAACELEAQKAYPD